MVDLVAFDIQKYLRDPEFAAEYLNGIIEEGDQDELFAALGELARAYGTAEMASAAKISRDSVYKALKPGANPTVATIRSILEVFGLQLAVVPIPKNCLKRRGKPVSEADRESKKAPPSGGAVEPV